MADALSSHDRIVAEAAEETAGAMPLAQGEGDSALVAFSSAKEALNCGIAILTRLAEKRWPPEISIEVRMGIHAGSATLRQNSYFGTALNKCARLRAVSHGGQILLTQAAHDACRDDLPEDVTLLDLGLHRLKDLSGSERIYQVRHPRLRFEFPAPASLESVPNNLPTQITIFVGREREIADIRKQLASSRLVTLSGPGGFGKTRLSQEVASQLLGDFPDGVWIVELASIRDPSLLTQEVASKVGALLDSSGSPDGESDWGRAGALESVLIRHIGERKILLVLDNCEHLLVECARISANLLASCPQLEILTTSREALGVPGEWSYPVRALSLPPEDETSVDRMLGFDSVRLFIERAELRRPDWALTSDNSASVLKLLHRLDGMPLAIELAAARLNVLTVHQITERLDDQFQLLLGTQALPQRHQTLSAVVAWSYELLAEDERRLFARLAAFSGGFWLEAAEVVCADELLPAGEVLGILSQLIDKSLVLVEEHGGGNRFSIHETIRHYARAKLTDSREQTVIRDRHLTWFLQLGEREGRGIRGSDQAARLNALEEDMENLRSAFGWSMASDQIEGGLRLAVALGVFFAVRGYLAEGRGWLQTAITACGDLPSLLRVKALAAAGLLARYQGDIVAAQSYLSEALRDSLDYDAEIERAGILVNLGYLARYRGDYETAREHFDQSLEIAREHHDRQTEAISLANLGLVFESEGDFEKARDFLEESLTISQDLDDKWVLGFVLMSLAELARSTGRLDEAKSLAEEALESSRALRDLRGVVANLNGLARLSRGGGDLTTSRVQAEEAYRIAHDLFDHRSVAMSSANLGLTILAEGDAPKAWPFLNESLKIAKDLGERPLSAEVLSEIASYLQQAGNQELGERFEAVSRQLIDQAGSASGDQQESVTKLLIELKRLSA